MENLYSTNSQTRNTLSRTPAIPQEGRKGSLDGRLEGDFVGGDSRMELDGGEEA
jgi:hypothetical protein